MADKQPSISVETVDQTATTRTVEVEVDAKRVSKAFERAYRELAKQVDVKGFRPGKAPRSVLTRLYGASVAEQLEHTLVSETLPDAMELAAIDPVAEPSIEAGKPDPEASFKYKAHLEVKPDLELPDLTGLPAMRPQVDVPDSEIDERLEQLRQSNAPLIEEPEGTVLGEGHTATIDFVGRIDGEAFEGGSGQGVSIEMGAGRFIPGFEEQLAGATAGEDRDLEVEFPEDYGNADVAGKQATFAAHVVDIRRRDVPELDDEFAKDMGDFDSLDALRARIREDMEQAAQRESDQTFRRTLMDGLLERIEFDVPPGMVERQLQGQISEAHRRMEGQIDHDTLHQQLDQFREQWRPQAERDVREMLLLEAVAKAQEIEIDDEAVFAKLDELVGDSASDRSRIEQFRSDEQLIGSLRAQLRDEQALDFLGSQAKVEESTGT
jgi:trigger factor